MLADFRAAIANRGGEHDFAGAVYRDAEIRRSHAARANRNGGGRGGGSVMDTAVHDVFCVEDGGLGFSRIRKHRKFEIRNTKSETSTKIRSTKARNDSFQRF